MQVDQVSTGGFEPREVHRARVPSEPGPNRRQKRQARHRESSPQTLPAESSPRPSSRRLGSPTRVSHPAPSPSAIRGACRGRFELGAPTTPAPRTRRAVHDGRFGANESAEDVAASVGTHTKRVAPGAGSIARSQSVGMVSRLRIGSRSYRPRPRPYQQLAGLSAGGWLGITQMETRS